MTSLSLRHSLRMLAIGVTMVGLALGLTRQVSAQGGYLVDTFNTAGVTNGPQNPTIVTLSQPASITTFATYHWNNGKGAIPGTIKFIALSASQTPTGVTYGPYGMGTQSGQTGVADVAWVGSMGGQGLLLAAGSYRVEDSDPNTWSTNAAAGYQGFVRLTGSYASTPPQPPLPPQPLPPVPQQPQPPASPLTVSLSPITFNTLVVNGQIQYTFTFAWTASGGTGGLNVTIQVEDPAYYGPSPLPGLRNMAYPARTSGTWNPTQIPTPGMMFRAMVTDSAGTVAYSAEQPIP